MKRKKCAEILKVVIGMIVQDAKVVDHACTALSRIAESYARHPDRLDMLCNHGLISNAVQLVRCVLLLGHLRTDQRSARSCPHCH